MKKVEVSVSYMGGLNVQKDRQLEKIAVKHLGNRTSSGCMMVGDMERDMQFAFGAKEKAKNFETEVELLGYKVQRSE